MSSRAHDSLTLRGDDTPVTGGLDDISRYLLNLPEPTIGPVDDLTREILTLFALHPEITLRCREADFATMNDATKRLMLEQIRRCLGIRPLRLVTP